MIKCCAAQMETAFVAFLGTHSRPTAILLRPVQFACWTGVVLRYTRGMLHDALPKAFVTPSWALSVIEGSAPLHSAN